MDGVEESQSAVPALDPDLMEFVSQAAVGMLSVEALGVGELLAGLSANDGEVEQ